MRVILSVEPVRFPLTGIGRYTYELAQALQQNPQVDELRLFGMTGFVPHLPMAGEQAMSSQRLKERIQKSRLASEVYRRLMPLIKRRALRHCESFIYHGTNFYLPPFPGRSIATFHDLSPFKWVDCAPPERIRFMQKELELTLRRANALITDSAFTRLELADYFGFPLDKIHAVPLASSAEFHPRNADTTRTTLNHYGLTHGGYSLYVGTIEPRKNLLNLLSAYERLPLSVRQRWPLVLSGFKGWRSDAIHTAIERASQQGWARYLGFVPANDLPSLFAGARLFCFPSLYEGFGLPVLEAMSSGVPVVCSNSSSLPEVAGKAALQGDPQDVEGLSSLLQQGLEDADWQAFARDEGLRHSQTFSWTRCAADTLAAYRYLEQI
ncbi:glycosyltransferase family 4 protein [Pseudomonas sp. J452]|uniref:glycosyltransferase family 4 protein n=1 Tax=Pseudomonas sp. J452 TaxID=2898441 RepID=UPI0021AE21AB|nr:glycosyltransferase family 1 protein [Pseudomonas sp. J452]UUY09834.1 glycosyltransferase family 4 protein [Pseudomonas sp. J452]